MIRHTADRCIPTLRLDDPANSRHHRACFNFLSADTLKPNAIQAIHMVNVCMSIYFMDLLCIITVPRAIAASKCALLWRPRACSQLTFCKRARLSVLHDGTYIEPAFDGPKDQFCFICLLRLVKRLTPKGVAYPHLQTRQGSLCPHAARDLDRSILSSAQRCGQGAHVSTGNKRQSCRGTVDPVDLELGHHKDPFPPSYQRKTKHPSIPIGEGTRDLRRSDRIYR